MTRLLLLMGDPVHHSLSPRMHNQAIRELGLSYVYVACQVRTGHLGAAIAGFRALGAAGANITIPHKENVMEFVDGLTETARRVGAINTLFWRDEALIGDNTDVAGFLSPLARADHQIENALIIGAGGAARAVAYGLRNVPSLTIAARTPDKAHRMADDLELDARVIPLSQASSMAAASDLIVNATPLGGPGHEDVLPVEATSLRPGSIAYDLLYSPSPTRFLRMAADLGAVTVDGREMLREQASAAFQRWTGKPFPPSVTTS